jgi:hypothetical protein
MLSRRYEWLPHSRPSGRGVEEVTQKTREDVKATNVATTQAWESYEEIKEMLWHWWKEGTNQLEATKKREMVDVWAMKEI